MTTLGEQDPFIVKIPFWRWLEVGVEVALLITAVRMVAQEAALMRKMVLLQF